MDDLIAEARISAPQVQHYLRRHGYPDAIVSGLKPLGESSDGLKSYGYGKPLAIQFRSQGRMRELVLRTMAPDMFGHDRRSDRVDTFILAFDSFDRIPQHVRAIDVGAFDEAGNMASFERGEPFLVTEYAGGELYARDLKAAAVRKEPTATDLDRAKALALYLSELHRQPVGEDAYVRSIRDTVGHGEGIFGLVDSYPEEHAVVPQSRAQALELEAVRWRHKLRRYPHRARRVHGDFHPFNILFRTGCDFSVLDASRGAAGDPADDVACLSINYAFFALLAGDDAFTGACRRLWDAFYGAYIYATGDRELFEVAPLFFAWRTLVVASPLWYPGASDALRDRMMRFAERLLAGEPFAPDRVGELLR
jgi:aminoglycoside phosphotransferase (APT) family kinase protein